MDTANLTFAQLFLTFLGSFLVGGIGLAVGWRILPIAKASRQVKTSLPLGPVIEKAWKQLTQPEDYYRPKF